MKRTSALIAGLALALSLAACGGSGGGGDDKKSALLDELRKDALSSGATQEQVDCVIAAIDDLSAEQLQSLKDDSPSAETQAAVGAAFGACVTPG